MSEQTIQEYYDDRKESGKADPATMMAMMGAIATAGRMWDEVPEAERTAEKAKEIAAASLEPLTTDRSDTTDLLFDKAGTREMVQAYTQDLIARSEAMDKVQSKAKGENLQAFLDEVADAVRDINFEEFKKGNLESVDLPAVREKIAEASRNHIGTVLPIDQDVIVVIGNDLKNPDGPEIFKDVTVEPERLSFRDNARVASLMATYATALIPKDKEKEQDVDKGPDKAQDDQALQLGTGGPKPDMEQPSSTGFRMRSMDDIMAHVGQMEKLPDDQPAAPLNDVGTRHNAPQAVPQQQKSGGRE